MAHTDVSVSVETLVGFFSVDTPLPAHGVHVHQEIFQGLHKQVVARGLSTIQQMLCCCDCYIVLTLSPLAHASGRLHLEILNDMTPDRSDSFVLAHRIGDRYGQVLVPKSREIDTWFRYISFGSHTGERNRFVSAVQGASKVSWGTTVTL